MQATIRYARRSVCVAYQVFGDGALDLVLVPAFISRQFECCSRDGFPVEPKSAYSVSRRDKLNLGRLETPTLAQPLELDPMPVLKAVSGMPRAGTST